MWEGLRHLAGFYAGVFHARHQHLRLVAVRTCVEHHRVLVYVSFLGLSRTGSQVQVSLMCHQHQFQLSESYLYDFFEETLSALLAALPLPQHVNQAPATHTTSSASTT